MFARLKLNNIFIVIDESEEELLVSRPMPNPPFAKMPSSAPRKLKTFYEALASEKNIITEEKDEELYESSAETTSSNRSSSGESMKTFIVKIKGQRFLKIPSVGLYVKKKNLLLPLSYERVDLKVRGLKLRFITTQINFLIHATTRMV